MRWTERRQLEKTVAATVVLVSLIVVYLCHLTVLRKSASTVGNSYVKPALVELHRSDPQ